MRNEESDATYPAIAVTETGFQHPADDYTHLRGSIGHTVCPVTTTHQERGYRAGDQRAERNNGTGERNHGNRRDSHQLKLLACYREPAPRLADDILTPHRFHQWQCQRQFHHYRTEYHSRVRQLLFCLHFQKW